MEDPHQHHMLITWTKRGHDSLSPPSVLLVVAIRRLVEIVHAIIFSFKTRKAIFGCWAKEAKMDSSSSSSMPEKSYHVRSISLPSTSHPITLKVEEEMNKLKTSAALSSATSALRLEMIHNGLKDLKNLYHCVGDFLQLPVT